MHDPQEGIALQLTSIFAGVSTTCIQPSLAASLPAMLGLSSLLLKEAELEAEVERLRNCCLDLQNRLQAAEARETELATGLAERESELHVARGLTADAQHAHDRLVEEAQNREDERRYSVTTARMLSTASKLKTSQNARGLAFSLMMQYKADIL